MSNPPDDLSNPLDYLIFNTPAQELKAPTMSELESAMEKFKNLVIEGIDGGPLVRKLSPFLPRGADYYANDKYGVLYWYEEGKAIKFDIHATGYFFGKRDRSELLPVADILAANWRQEE